MSWAENQANLNAAMLAEFGEPVVYQPVQAGQPAGDPITITAIRRSRAREESGPSANFEEIEIDPSLLPNSPAKADRVTAWGMEYSVVTARQPNPYGLAIVTMVQRAGQTLP